MPTEKTPNMQENPLYFFSIVIPAHNEEKYLGETLKHVCMLDYPKDRFEAIVVENGSTDRTLPIARGFERDNVRILQSEKGVSRAKNLGLDNTSQKSDWTIFLDADTCVAPLFLRELSKFLNNEVRRDAAVGAVSLRPIEKMHWYVPLFMSFYNFSRKIMHIPFALEIMRTSLRSKVRFDETIQFAEDVKLIEDGMRYGSFFFFPTRTVSTSIRRFEKIGWGKQLFLWGWQGLVLSKTNHRSDVYPVIR
ncbi:hypothetical protein A3A39_04535 [Candidatus Kaiserbacteria bacterium RIFCSPLOWO2_01_FULL_54_13]|uniref:Glycosyltransferase 2-like domain-containing protein n=1 Tax=Candidatus Kaiserbacteria bacterium RIFCSPLOWO2_01_FULL_54_13 TaxID=1798512 RepID=A0A1F6F1P0_9BACT|nr:MAG: hypothetical protein A3A39_04535 [Candidatus Kaiserbacteria bacterium RIFCSPLOWO2_01_FULL_54_13]